MRMIALTLSLVLALSSAALAQSELFFRPTAPVEPGSTVKGLITQANGVTTLGDVYVRGKASDDLFTYWVGDFKGERYVYDPYTTYWRSNKVVNRRATLDFQGRIVEGWTRQFGAVLDSNHFFGNDGVYYKRIVIKRNRTRSTNRRRQVIYSYFINTQTGERSDSGSPPYIVIGGADGDFVKLQMQQKQDAFMQVIREFPAFPMWQTVEFQAPGEIVIHNGAPPAGDDNLLVLGSSELGALSVDK